MPTTSYNTTSAAYSTEGLTWDELTNYIEGFPTTIIPDIIPIPRRASSARKELETFFRTGCGRIAYVGKGNILYLYSSHSLIATISKRKIKLHTRALEFKDLFEQLAKREWLTLEIVDDLTEIPARPIVYWKWKVMEEVDDTDLVTTTKVAEPRTEINLADVPF